MTVKLMSMQNAKDLMHVIGMYAIVFLSKLSLIQLDATSKGIDINQVVHDISNAIISIAGLMVTLFSAYKTWREVKKAVKEKKSTKEKDEALQKAKDEIENLKKQIH